MDLLQCAQITNKGVQDATITLPNFILKFADETVMTCRTTIKTSHGPVVDEFLNWCRESFFELNVIKTKDMCIDLSGSGSTVINGQAVETVQSLNTWAPQLTTNILYKQSQHCLFGL